MASPTIDTNGPSGVVSFSTTNTGAITYTTSQTNDVILVAIASEQTSVVNVSSVTSAHLTFTFRGRKSGAAASGRTATIELWWAPSTGTLSSEVITVTMASNIDDAIMFAVGVHGCHSISAPFDSNVSLPGVGSVNGSGVAEAVISTSQADDLIMSFFASTGGNVSSGTPVGATTLTANGNNGGGLGICSIGSFRSAVSSTQSNLSVGQTGLTSTLSIPVLVDVLTADASTSTTTGTVTQTFGGITMAVSGKGGVKSTVAQTFGGITQLAEGTPTVDHGTVTQTFKGINMAVSGKGGVKGTVAQTFGGIALVVGGVIPGAAGTGKSYSSWTTKS